MFNRLLSFQKTTELILQKSLAFRSHKIFQELPAATSSSSFSHSAFFRTYSTSHKHFNRFVGSSYEVSFRCPVEERQKFHTSRCLIPISVGQKIHEGDKLKDTLSAISNNFSSCVLMVDDSIQAATKMLNEDMTDLTGEHQWQSISSNVIRAIAEGDDWLKRNRQIIESQIAIPMRIIRWYEWRVDPSFNRAISETRDLYNHDEKFKGAINQNIIEFLDRYEKSRPLSSGYSRLQAEWFCREYLLEECAVMMYLWPKLGCEYEVYPNGRNTAMQAAFDLSIKHRFPNLLKPVALRFHKLQPKIESKSDDSVDDNHEAEKINPLHRTIGACN